MAAAELELLHTYSNRFSSTILQKLFLCQKRCAALLGLFSVGFIVACGTFLIGGIHTIRQLAYYSSAKFGCVPCGDMAVLRYGFEGQQTDGTCGGIQAERSFKFSAELFETMGFPLNLDYVASLTESNFDRFVFVTAASSNHFHEAMDAIALVQQYFPHHTLYYYDLSADAPDGFVEKMRQLCGVVYRVFNYSLYPAHVKTLATYAFKPLIIHEILREHTTLFWIDASIRFMTSNFDVIRRQAVYESRGVLLFDYTGHSIFAATHETMYKYLPISKPAAVNVSMMGANAIYIHGSREVYDAVIRWWVLCALEPSCIAPTRDLFCQFNGRDQYAKCHRYDQSAINILLCNFFENDLSKCAANDTVLDVRRDTMYVEKLRVCSPGKPVTAVKSNQYF